MSINYLRAFVRTMTFASFFCRTILALGVAMTAHAAPYFYTDQGSTCVIPPDFSLSNNPMLDVSKSDDIFVYGQEANNTKAVLVSSLTANCRVNDAFGGHNGNPRGQFRLADLTSYDVKNKSLLVSEQGVYFTRSARPDFSAGTTDTIGRLTAEGKLDTQWATQGDLHATNRISSHTGTMRLLVDSQDRLIYAKISNYSDLTISRHLSNGQPDTSFTPNNVFAESSPVAGQLFIPRIETYPRDSINSFTQLADGKLLLNLTRGYAETAQNAYSNFHSFSVETRLFSANGEPITSFGNNGVLQTQLSTPQRTGWSADGITYAPRFSHEALGAYAFSDNSIAIIGYDNGVEIHGVSAAGQPNNNFNSGQPIKLSYALGSRPEVRMLANDELLIVGRLETNGVSRLEALFYNRQGQQVRRIALDNLGMFRVVDVVTRNNKILILGFAQGDNQPKLARLHLNGTLDLSFNSAFTPAVTSIIEGGQPVAIQPQIKLYTPADNFDGSELLVLDSTANTQSEINVIAPLQLNAEQLRLDGVVIGTASRSAGSLRIRFNSAATPERINRSLALISYRHPGPTPPARTRVNWTFTAPDQSEANASINITITAIDSPPSLTVDAAAVSFIEGADRSSQAIAIAPELRIADDAFSNPQTYSEALIQLISNDNNDLLQLPAITGFSAQYTNGDLTISGTGKSLSQWQEALRRVQFVNNSDTPLTTDRTVSVTLYDGELVSNTASKTIKVTAMNDSPIITAPASITAIEDILSSVNGIAISDPDAGSAVLNISVSVSRGLLSLPDATPSSELALSDNLSALNAKLQQLSYLPALNDNAATTLTIQVNDNGNSGEGGAKTATRTITLNITPINDAPEMSGTPSISVLQDQPYHFAPTASDVDNTNEQLSFSIANKPAWMQFNTTTGTLNGTPRNDNVGQYPNIVISVSDGTLSTSLAPFTIEVINVNDPPSISGTPNPVAVENEAYQFTPQFFDPDLQHGQILSFTVENLPSWASFNVATGEITGTPISSDYGNYRAVEIYVSDGEFNASIPAFDIFVKRAPVLFTSHDFWGEQAKEHFGQALALFDADVNGYSELIAGAPDRADLINGKMLKQTGAINFITPAITDSRSLFGSEKKQRLGAAIAVTADQNQDDVPDLIIGNPKAGKGGEISLYSGADGSLIRVILQGQASKTAPIVKIMPLCTIDPHHIICRLLGGVAQGAAIGEVVAVADANGDGIEDLIVGLPQTTVKTPAKLNKAGTVVVYDGLTNTPIYTRSGSQAGELFGSAVAINQIDQQLLVGSTMFDVKDAKKIANAGRVQHFDLIDGSNAALFSIEGSDKNQFFGDALASVEQDLDGDGQLDWLVAQPGSQTAAQVQLFSGSNILAFAEINIEAPKKRNSIVLASGADTNADDINDIAIGLPLANRPIQQPNAEQKTLKQAGLVRLLSGHQWQHQ